MVRKLWTDRIWLSRKKACYESILPAPLFLDHLCDWILELDPCREYFYWEGAQLPDEKPDRLILNNQDISRYFWGLCRC